MELKLYYFESCPYCYIVLKAIEDLIDIHKNEEDREFLFKKTGRYTVPCLFIDDNPMHESYDIIQWLKENREKIKKYE